jgi:hypothetical protein
MGNVKFFSSSFNSSTWTRILELLTKMILLYAEGQELAFKQHGHGSGAYLLRRVPEVLTPILKASERNPAFSADVVANFKTRIV